jgi:hypothetical protein
MGVEQVINQGQWMDLIYDARHASERSPLQTEQTILGDACDGNQEGFLLEGWPAMYSITQRVDYVQSRVPHQKAKPPLYAVLKFH